MPQFRRRFEVYPVPDEERTSRVVTQLVVQSKRKNKRDAFETKEVKDEREQFDVYFPNGSSIRIIGRDELERLGLHEGAGLVDMETGEDVPENFEPMTLRELVARNTQLPRGAATQ